MTRPVDIVNKLCPKAKSSYVAAIARGDGLFIAHDITTPLRLAHFFAQIFHESGGLTIEWESGAYSAQRLLEIFGEGNHSAAISPEEAKALAYNSHAIFERVYGLGNPKKAKELGNTAPGDGFKFRGGGLMQTTGKSNYRRMGQKMQPPIDLVGHPEAILSIEYALQPALIEWSEDGLNAYADRDDALAISRAINLGSPKSLKTPNGMADRANWLRRIKPLAAGVEFQQMAEWPAPKVEPTTIPAPPPPAPTPAPPPPAAPPAAPTPAPPPPPAAAGWSGVVAAISRFLSALFKRGQQP